jgi:pentatricopeptide repeat protein
MATAAAQHIARLVASRGTSAATASTRAAFAPARRHPSVRPGTRRVTTAVFVGDEGTAAAGDDNVDSDEVVTLKDVTRKLMDCRKRKAASNAVDLLVSLGRAGIEPDLLASTTCLGACVAAGKMDLALKVFEEVFEKKVVQPDEVVFTELIRGYLAADPPSWTRAMNTLDKMERFDVSPSSLSYNVLLAKCAADNELERAGGRRGQDGGRRRGARQVHDGGGEETEEHPQLRQEGAHAVSTAGMRGDAGVDAMY